MFSIILLLLLSLRTKVYMMPECNVYSLYLCNKDVVLHILQNPLSLFGHMFHVVGCVWFFAELKKY